MVPIMPVITVMNMKLISKGTAWSKQPCSQLKFLQLLLSVMEEHTGSYCCEALIFCWMCGGSLRLSWSMVT